MPSSIEVYHSPVPPNSGSGGPSGVVGPRTRTEEGRQWQALDDDEKRRLTRQRKRRIAQLGIVLLLLILLAILLGVLLPGKDGTGVRSGPQGIQGDSSTSSASSEEADGSSSNAEGDSGWVSTVRETPAPSPAPTSFTVPPHYRPRPWKNNQDPPDEP